MKVAAMANTQRMVGDFRQVRPIANRPGRLRMLVRALRPQEPKRQATRGDRLSYAVAHRAVLPKGIPKPIPDQLRDLRLAESELAPGEFILALQRAAEQSRIVRVQDNRHARVKQSPHGMLGQRRHRAGSQVAA